MNRYESESPDFHTFLKTYGSFVPIRYIPQLLHRTPSYALYSLSYSTLNLQAKGYFEDYSFKDYCLDNCNKLLCS